MNAWPDNENVLARFRGWLEEARAEADAIADEELPEAIPSVGHRGCPTEWAGESDSLGLSQFVQEFTALRHELKLQTKSSRGLAEQTEATLKTMQEAIDLFGSIQAKESQAAQRAAKPLVESLLDLDEALYRGRAVIDAAHRHILEDLSGKLQDQLDELWRRQPVWRRWICRRWHHAAREILLQRTALIHRDVFDSLVEGYGLILKRLGRAMEKEGVYRIQCVGKPVDSNTMTVVEAVVNPLQPPGIVVEEVRPGYYWKDKVIRFAEVRAIQGRTA